MSVSLKVFCALHIGISKRFMFVLKVIMNVEIAGKYPIGFGDSHVVPPNGHSVTCSKLCIINSDNPLILLFLLVMTQTEIFCINI